MRLTPIGGPSYVLKSRSHPSGICAEAARILENCYVSPGVIKALRRVSPTRQVEAAEHMFASGNCSVLFARGLVEISNPDSIVVQPGNRKFPTSARLRAKLQKEAPSLVRNLARIRQNYGREMLTLIVASRYVERLLADHELAHHISRYHPEALSALRFVLVTTKHSDLKRKRRTSPSNSSKKSTQNIKLQLAAGATSGV